MHNVTRFPRGVQLDMSTAKEQIRASIAMTHAIPIAERLLQADKTNPSFKLSDLLDDNERAIYIDAVASFLLDQAGRLERTEALNQCRAHGHALGEVEQRAVERQARQDVILFGDALMQAFLQTNPQYCPLCKEKLGPCGVADVKVTEGITCKAHSLCCAKNDRFEFISEFLYRLTEAR